MTSETAEALRLWIAAPQIGASSEVWLQRQLVRLEADTRRILTWRLGPDGLATAIHPVVLPAPSPGLNELGRRRWLHRAGRWWSGNYYGAGRREVEALTRDVGGRDRPNALLAHFGHTGLRMLRLTRDLDIPCVVHFHGLDLSSMLAMRWYRESLRRNIGRFDAMICVGTAQRERLLGLGADPRRVHVIPCGVPTSEFAAADQPDDGGPIRFVTVGRLVPQKGVETVLRALARMPAPAHLTIVGDGPERPRLLEISKALGVEDRVRFAGRLRAAEVYERLKRSHALIQHSREIGGWSEGFGVTVAEAAAVGRPVIVSDVGGLVDQVVDGVTGCVTPQGDVPALAAGMMRLASDAALRDRMGQAGRARVAAHFDTDRQVDRLRAVLLQAVRDRRAAASSP